MLTGVALTLVNDFAQIQPIGQDIVDGPAAKARTTAHIAVPCGPPLGIYARVAQLFDQRQYRTQFQIAGINMPDQFSFVLDDDKLPVLHIIAE